jgi:hypothetical protein
MSAYRRAAPRGRLLKERQRDRGRGEGAVLLYGVA